MPRDMPRGNSNTGHLPCSLHETPVIALCMPGDTYSVMISNIKEMKARGAPVIAIGTDGDRESPGYC